MTAPGGQAGGAPRGATEAPVPAGAAAGARAAAIDGTGAAADAPAGAEARETALRVTPAAPGDAAALGAILSDWIDATPWMPRLHTRDADAAFVAHLIATCDVRVLRGPAPCGFIALRDGTVPALYLAAGARRRGGGTLLLRGAMRDHRRLELWTFAANEGALAFYRRAGFAAVETTDGAGNDEGLPDVRLVWTAKEDGA